MQDHIKNNILPQKLTKYKGFKLDREEESYNQAISIVHAVLPQVVEYIYADLEEKIDNLPCFKQNGQGFVLQRQDVLDLLPPNQE